MKKCLYLVFLAVFVLIAACQTDIGQVSLQSNDRSDVFYATLETPSEADSQTKVYADSQMRVLWNAGDHITIFNKKDANVEYKFDGSDGENFGSFSLVGTDTDGNALPYFYALYPYSWQTAIDAEGKISLTLPVRQEYKKNSFGVGANTMVSVTEDSYLCFKNAGGYLSFKLYGKGVSVKSITLRGNNHEKLSGGATVSMAVGGTPTMVMKSSATEYVTLTCATPVALGATPDDFIEFWFALPPTVFSQGFTITVLDNEGGRFEKTTQSVVSITRNYIARMSSVEVAPVLLSYEAVDLGLPSGLKWASCNIGATRPEESGDYFAWGETESKAVYDWSNYKWCNGTKQSLFKYNAHKSLGQVDNKWILEPDDDVAHVKWGGSWRMPAWWERSELMDECDWTWTAINGVNGYEIKSRINGNSIFLPAAGSTDGDDIGIAGLYWAENMWTGNSATGSIICFDSDGVYDTYICNRKDGLPVRPVSDEGVRVAVTGVSLNPSEITMTEGESKEIIASVAPSNATQSAVIWSSSSTGVATVSVDGIVKAISAGTATITATTYDGGFSASCKVTILVSTNATGNEGIGHVNW